jgi:hypothetical protein
MAEWNNGPLVVYHGTDSAALAAYGSLVSSSPLPAFKVDITLCRPNTDFGQGFYLTSHLHQARQWANSRVRLSRLRGSADQAVVLSFAIDRDLLASAEALAFVIPTTDYWELVHHCRTGLAPHRRSGTKQRYDIVYGPLSLWPRELIIHDCDQLSVHDQKFADQLPTPHILEIGRRADGLLG